MKEVIIEVIQAVFLSLGVIYIAFLDGQKKKERNSFKSTLTRKAEPFKGNISSWGSAKSDVFARMKKIDEKKFEEGVESFREGLDMNLDDFDIELDCRSIACSPRLPTKG